MVSYFNGSGTAPTHGQEISDDIRSIDTSSHGSGICGFNNHCIA
uniref:Uncharacterized protein n=1 Tax=Vitis vinifera TaxID=29760 RepID=F6HB72_VITVI